MRPCTNLGKRIYGTLRELADVGKETDTIRIIRKHPTTPWKRVWSILHSAWIPDPLKSAWYVAIHEIISTNERLASIRLADTDRCNLCGNTDSLQHRLTRCGTGSVIWNWTRARLAAITRTDPRTIPEEWTMGPGFLFWPPPKQAALLWILAHLVVYRTQSNRRLPLQDSTDFLRRARSTTGRKVHRRELSGSPLVPQPNDAHPPNFIDQRTRATHESGDYSAHSIQGRSQSNPNRWQENLEETCQSAHKWSIGYCTLNKVQ
jgi:hypothetical protein